VFCCLLAKVKLIYYGLILGLILLLVYINDLMQASNYSLMILMFYAQKIITACGDKRRDYQNCSVLYCVLKLCTVISTLR